MIRTAPGQLDIPVRHSVLGIDNPLNRVLRAALEVVTENSEWNGVRRAAGSLLEYFRGVGQLNQNDFSRVSFNPLNERFRPVYIRRNNNPQRVQQRKSKGHGAAGSFYRYGSSI